MKRVIKKQWFLYGAAGLAASYAMMSVVSTQPEVERLPMKQTVNQSSYTDYIMSRGVVEPASEILKIKPSIEGRVERIYVRAGQKVQQGTPLFALESFAQRSAYEEAMAQVKLAEARLSLAESAIAAADIAVDDTRLKQREADTRLERFQPLLEEGISRDEFDRIVTEAGQAANDTRLAEHQREVVRLKRDVAAGELEAARATLATTQVALQETVVYAPVAGHVLSVDVTAGQVVSLFDAGNASVSLGDLETLYVRVEINENELQQFDQSAKAQAFIRGRKEEAFALDFVALDPLLKAKTNFADVNRERVDTRILEVTYRIANSAQGQVYPGQLLDVYIDASAPVYNSSPATYSSNVAPAGIIEPARSRAKPLTSQPTSYTKAKSESARKLR
jgi:HlyD family secretion protein